MSSESSLLIQEYYKSNQYIGTIDTENKYTFTQGNTLCGDIITVDVIIQDHILTDYKYHGEPSQITKAAAEFIGEFVIGTKTETILTRDADRVRDQGFEVSHRRIRSSVSALLAIRNCIHQHLNDGRQDEYEDLI